MAKIKIIKHILEEKGIILPLPLLKNECILQLEKALSSGNPYLVSRFYGRIASNIDECVRIEWLDEFIVLSSRISEEISKKYGKFLTLDDEKILDFLVSNAQFPEDFLAIVGPFYYLCRVADELENNKKISDILFYTILLWIFVNLYEILLHHVDRRIYYYITSNNLEARFGRFMNIRRDKGEHATAGLINKILSAILGISPKNQSLFGETSTPKIIRNKISHSNIFYEPEKKKIITLDGNEYSTEDFLKQYSQIYVFLIRWMEKSLGAEICDTNFKSEVVKSLKNIFKDLSRAFLQVERSPEHRKAFAQLIIKLKKAKREDNP